MMVQGGHVEELNGIRWEVNRLQLNRKVAIPSLRIDVLQEPHAGKIGYKKKKDFAK